MTSSCTRGSGLYWEAISSIARAHNLSRHRGGAQAGRTTRTFATSPAVLGFVSLSAPQPPPSSPGFIPCPPPPTPPSVSSASSVFGPPTRLRPPPRLSSSLSSSSIIDIYEADSPDYDAASTSVWAVDESFARAAGAGQQQRVEARSPCAGLSLAVKHHQFRRARELLIELHELELEAVEEEGYLEAALDCLTSRDLERPEDRLEWFIQFYALVPTRLPPDPSSSSTTNTPQSITEANNLINLLLSHPSETARLSRIAMLFAEKGQSTTLSLRLLPHLVRYGGPRLALDLLGSLRAAARWKAGDEGLARAVNETILGLVKSGHPMEAAEVLDHWRAAAPRSGLERPTIRRSAYLALYRSLSRLHPPSHPSLFSLSSLMLLDYPDLSSILLSEPARSFPPPPHLTFPPSATDLPSILRDLSRSASSISASSLSYLLESLYSIPRPRPRLLGLLHRLVVRPPPSSSFSRSTKEDSPRGVGTWVLAELLRLERAGEHHEVLRLFAARHHWVGLPSGPRWQAYADVQPLRPEDVGLSEDIFVLLFNAASVTKQAPSKHTTALIIKVIAAVDGNDKDLLLEDYRSFLDNTLPRSSHRPTPSTASPLFRSLASKPIPSPSLTAPPAITPWSTPTPFPSPFTLPPSSSPSTFAFVPFLHALGRHSPSLALSALRDLTARGHATPLVLWIHTLVAFVHHGRGDEALAYLDLLEREAGFDLSPPRERATSGGVDPFGVVSPSSPSDRVPKLQARVYVRMAVEAARRDDPSLVRSLEARLRASGCPLSESDQLLMVNVYHRLYTKGLVPRPALSSSALAALGPSPAGLAPPSVRLLSPWGFPTLDPPSPLTRQFSAPRLDMRLSPPARERATALGKGVGGWASTERDNATPVWSRVRAAVRRERARLKVQEGEARKLGKRQRQREEMEGRELFEEETEDEMALEQEGKAPKEEAGKRSWDDEEVGDEYDDLLERI